MKNVAAYMAHFANYRVASIVNMRERTKKSKATFEKCKAKLDDAWKPLTVEEQEVVLDAIALFDMGPIM